MKKPRLQSRGDMRAVEAARFSVYGVAMRGETTLQMVQRHVREGETILARQRGVIARLEGVGADTAQAHALMFAFEEAQAEHVGHLERLLANRT